MIEVDAGKIDQPEIDTETERRRKRKREEGSWKRQKGKQRTCKRKREKRADIRGAGGEGPKRIRETGETGSQKYRQRQEN